MIEIDLEAIFFVILTPSTGALRGGLTVCLVLMLFKILIFYTVDPSRAGLIMTHFE